MIKLDDCYRLLAYSIAVAYGLQFVWKVAYFEKSLNITEKFQN